MRKLTVFAAVAVVAVLVATFMALSLATDGPPVSAVHDAAHGCLVNGVFVAAVGEFFIVDGTAEDDKIDCIRSSDSVTVNASAGDDNVRGSVHDDELNGEGGDDHLRGGDGDDTLNGGPGIDNLFGGKGDDDTCNGGAGVDNAHPSCEAVSGIGEPSGEVICIAALGSFIANGKKVTGTDGDDVIDCSDTVDAMVELRIDGGDGNDEITGGNGEDKLHGGKGNDICNLGAGDTADGTCEIVNGP